MIPFALPPAEARLPLSAVAGAFIPSEEDFAGKLGEHLGLGTCVLAGSARSLLYLLLRNLRRRTGKSEVLLPGYTCYSLAAAAVKAGCMVSLYDLEPQSLQPDLEDVRRKVNPATLAVVGQHLLGRQSDIGALAEISRRHGACCVEDSAQHLAPPPPGIPPPGGADFTIFSFGRGKPLPLGYGGALFARRPEGLSPLSVDAGLPRRPATGLMSLAVQILSWPSLYWILERLPLGLGSTIFDPGFTPDAMPGFYRRLGAAALADLARLNRHRVEISRLYRAHLAGSDDPEAGERSMPPYVRYPLLVRGGKGLRGLVKYGVRRLYPLALCDLPALRGSVIEYGRNTPGSQEIARCLVTLPTHSAVDKRMAKKIAREVADHFDKITSVTSPSRDSEQA